MQLNEPLFCLVEDTINSRSMCYEPDAPSVKPFVRLDECQSEMRMRFTAAMHNAGYWRPCDDYRTMIPDGETYLLETDVDHSVAHCVCNDKSAVVETADENYYWWIVETAIGAGKTASNCSGIPALNDIIILGPSPSSLTESSQSDWFHYYISKDGSPTQFKSQVLIPKTIEGVNRKRYIQVHIEQRGGLEAFPQLSDLQDDIREWVKNCNESDNEMYYVSMAEYFEGAGYWKFNEIDNNIALWNLGEVVVQNFDPVFDNPLHAENFFTIYGGSASYINWVEEDDT